MNNGINFALISMLVFLPLGVTGQTQEKPAPADATPSAPTTVEITGSAQRVYLDPQTGRMLNEPPAGAQVMALSPAELNMISTSHQGLVEQALPGGGYMVDLQGRFRSMAVATVADDGTIVISEVAGEAFLPASSAQPEKNEKHE
jgi:hypothetical protein